MNEIVLDPAPIDEYVDDFNNPKKVAIHIIRMQLSEEIRTLAVQIILGREHDLTKLKQLTIKALKENE